MAFSNPAERDIDTAMKRKKRKLAEWQGAVAFSSGDKVCPYKIEHGERVTEETILFARWWTGWLRMHLKEPDAV